MPNPYRKIICALDTTDLERAVGIVQRLSPEVSTFKVGHALTLSHGLGVIDRLQEAGAKRIFLDLKFHDIPNSVALAVRQAGNYGVWMMTLHIAGGPAMMQAAAEEADAFPADRRPLLVGVSVLTSLDEPTLHNHLGVTRSLESHMVELSRLALASELDGVVCSAHEITPIREAVGAKGVIVTPGIRLASGPTHDQKRVGDASKALEDGADYLVIGRALTECEDIGAALDNLGAVLA